MVYKKGETKRSRRRNNGLPSFVSSPHISKPIASVREHGHPGTGGKELKLKSKNASPTSVTQPATPLPGRRTGHQRSSQGGQLAASLIQLLMAGSLAGVRPLGTWERAPSTGRTRDIPQAGKRATQLDPDILPHLSKFDSPGIRSEHI